MNSTLLRRLLALVALLVLAPSPAHADEDDDVVIPLQVVVRLQPGVAVGALNAQYQSTTLDSIPAERWYLLGTPPGLNEEEFAQILALDTRVAEVELHYTGRDNTPDPGTQSIFFSSTMSQYLEQSALTAIGLAGASANPGGAGVRVAVIDSGADALHPALEGRLIPGFNFIEGNGDTRDLGDGLDNDGDGQIDESVGHGTAAAGLVVRIAPNAKVMPLRVLDSDGLTTVFRVSAAIYHAADQGAHIINLSLGTTADQRILQSAVQYATARGVLVVASTGNEGNLTPVRYPAGLSPAPGVVAVAGTDSAGLIAPFSNYGPHVTISAPSVMIVSAIPGAAYGAANGTSFGAPLVCGTVALVLSRMPSPDPVLAGQRVVSTTTPIGVLNPNYPGWMGSGLLNVTRALSLTRPHPLRRSR
ncbi:MAG: S8 family peptidase [Phycisphaerales bacterium]